MKVINLFYFVLFFNFLQSCGNQPQDQEKSKSYVSDIEISEDLDVLTSEMTENDTIKILANLTMEWWVRLDELIISKKNESVFIQATIKEDTTMELKYEMRVNELPKVKIKTTDKYFENHFVSKLERVNSPQDPYAYAIWIYKIINQSDTLVFNTHGLGDRGGLIDDYFQFMQEFYPNQEEYKLIDVIEEPELENQ